MNSDSNTAKTPKGRRKIGFIVVIALWGIMGIFAAPRFLTYLSARNSDIALQYEAHIQNFYDRWASLGCTHPNKASHELTLALFEVLGSRGSDDANSGPVFHELGGDPRAIFEPHHIQGTVRDRMPGNGPAIATINGSAEVVYSNRFILRFTPTSNHSGKWSVIPIE